MIRSQRPSGRHQLARRHHRTDAGISPSGDSQFSASWNIAKPSKSSSLAPASTLAVIFYRANASAEPVKAIKYCFIDIARVFSAGHCDARSSAVQGQQFVHLCQQRTPLLLITAVYFGSHAICRKLILLLSAHIMVGSQTPVSV